MPCAEFSPAELIRLAETTLHQPDGFQDFFSAVSRLLAGAHYRVINQAYRQIHAPDTWRTFDDCVNAAASRWEGVLPGAATPCSLAVFAIPLSLVAPSGAVWKGELSDVTLHALQAGMEHFAVICNSEQLFLSPQLVPRHALKCATAAQKHRLMQRICRKVERAGNLPVFHKHHAWQEGLVQELYLIGVASGDTHGGRPLFYQASAEQLLQWTQLCSAQLQIALAGKGSMVEIEAGPPDLLYYALEFGAYRSRLIALEAQVSRQIERTGMHPSEYMAIISRHPDGCIRLSLYDTDARMQRFLFGWPERLFEDAQQVLQDLASMLQDLGLTDIRLIPGMQYAAQGRYGVIPTLEDLEHNRTLQ